jgi:hypothetical protein
MTILVLALVIGSMINTTNTILQTLTVGKTSAMRQFRSSLSLSPG